MTLNPRILKSYKTVINANQEVSIVEHAHHHTLSSTLRPWERLAYNS